MRERLRGWRRPLGNRFLTGAALIGNRLLTGAALIGNRLLRGAALIGVESHRLS